jgi:hypothetical protein
MVVDAEVDFNPALASSAHTNQPLAAFVLIVVVMPLLTVKAVADRLLGKLSEAPERDMVKVGATVPVIV